MKNVCGDDTPYGKPDWNDHRGYNGRKDSGEGGVRGSKKRVKHS